MEWAGRDLQAHLVPAPHPRWIHITRPWNCSALHPVTAQMDLSGGLMCVGDWTSTQRSKQVREELPSWAVLPWESRGWTGTPAASTAPTPLHCTSRNLWLWCIRFSSCLQVYLAGEGLVSYSYCGKSPKKYPPNINYVVLCFNRFVRSQNWGIFLECISALSYHMASTILQCKRTRIIQNYLNHWFQSQFKSVKRKTNLNWFKSSFSFVLVLFSGRKVIISIW